MIFRAQSLRSLKAQRTTHLPTPSKLPCTASQRHGGAFSRHGSVPELQKLQTVECADPQRATHSQVLEPTIRGPEVRAAEDDSTVLSATTFVTAFGLLLLGGPAYAAYDRAAGDQLFKNIAGGAYVLLVCFFFYRLFRKRAASGTSQSLRGQFQESIQDEMKASDTIVDDKPVTPLGAFWGAVQAGAICFVLFQICGLVDGYFANQEMPDQYTARNVTVTLRTIVRGLAYLMTFLFGVNCVGLTGLAVQLLFIPDKAGDSPSEDKAQS